MCRRPLHGSQKNDRRRDHSQRRSSILARTIHPYSSTPMVSRLARDPKAPHSPYGLALPGACVPAPPSQTPPPSLPESIESVMNLIAPSAINT